MTTDTREEAFRQALRTALGELVEEEWDAMASLPVDHPVSRRCRARMRRILSGRSESRKPQGVMKKIGIGIALVIVLALAALLIAVFGGGEKIGKEAALQAALADAGLTRDQVRDVEIDLERGLRSARYEIDFESGLTEYEYKVDAYSGEILSAKTDD